MATNTRKLTATPTAKRAAPAPKASTSGAATTATTQTPKGTAKAKAAAPQAPLFKAGTMPPVRGGTHRAYAQTVARTLTKQHKAGFTLAQYRAALVAGAAASSIAPPQQGWAAHNMPTWCANPKQAWLVPA